MCLSIKTMLHGMCSEYIDVLPLANTPEVFGLHPNAEIGYYTNAAKEMWSQMIELQPQTGQSVKTPKLENFVSCFISKLKIQHNIIQVIPTHRAHTKNSLSRWRLE